MNTDGLLDPRRLLARLRDERALGERYVLARAAVTVVEQLLQQIKDIQGALNTEETGEALVEVARNACRAEQELASLHREYDDGDQDQGLRGTGERGS